MNTCRPFRVEVKNFRVVVSSDIELNRKIFTAYIYICILHS